MVYPLKGQGQVFVLVRDKEHELMATVLLCRLAFVLSAS